MLDREVALFGSKWHGAPEDVRFRRHRPEVPTESDF
jgi:hypothetical protein